MFGFRKAKTTLNEMEFHIRHLSSMYHKHRQFPSNTYRNVEISIDTAIEILWNERKELQNTIAQIQADLTAIHAHYRDYLCGDCCHQDVCKIKDSVKYGFECEDKGCPESVEIEIELVEEELSPEETEGTE